VHHVGILCDQFMMHGQRNIKLQTVEFPALEFVTSASIYLSVRSHIPPDIKL